MKKTKLVEEQKIGIVLEKKRLERFERKRKAEQRWLEVRETISFIKEYDVLSWKINENIPEDWKTEGESITPRSQQSLCLE